MSYDLVTFPLFFFFFFCYIRAASEVFEVYAQLCYFFHPIYIHTYICGIIRFCLVKLVSEVRNPLPFDANNHHYNVLVLIYSIVIKEKMD